MDHQWMEAIAPTAEQRAIEVLSEGRTPERLRELVWHAHELGDALVARRWREVTGALIACQPGCSYCCKFRIQASPPEVLVIAEHLKGQLQETEREAFLSEMRRLAREAARMDVFGWGIRGCACPLLLLTGRCSIYDLRPFICRAWHSTNVEACQQGDCLSDAYAYAIPLRVLDGLERGLARAGLQGEPVELITALDEVMRDSKAMENWLAGSRVFERSTEVARKDNLRIHEDMNRGGCI